MIPIGSIIACAAILRLCYPPTHCHISSAKACTATDLNGVPGSSLHNSSTGDPETIWFCETGPSDLWRPTDANYTINRGRAWRNHRSSRYLPTPNLYRQQWAPAPLAPGSDPASVMVDLSVPRLHGAEPLAVRYAWPLFDGFHGPTADTCCPTRSLQDGHGPCLPGSCPLYTATSELPANPFFATVVGSGVEARCRCMAPQSCEA